MTVVVGDLAGLFGCVCGLDPGITAITFVALGTSMPDLFASKAAATAEPSADACIGNVTGSNCVNVFLGLGLPWTIGAIYWSAVEKGGTIQQEWQLKYGHLPAVHRACRAAGIRFLRPSRPPRREQGGADGGGVSGQYRVHTILQGSRSLI